ncbi:MAG: NAD(+) kinase [bacterium]
MIEFKRIGIHVQLGHEQVRNTVNELIALLIGRNIEVLLDEQGSDIAGNGDVSVANFDQLASTSDMVIVVGGDGTMLGAGRDFADYDVPLLGVNRGRLGFLTDISPEELDKVGDVLDGKYVSTRRFLLDMKTSRNGEPVGSGVALNDVVLHPGKSIRMMELELYIDRQFVYSQRSDGLIVSTPTGSTAYALSAGGPILHPSMNAVVLVPMNAHTLTSRPIAVSADSRVDILVGPRNEVHPLVTCDGQHDISTRPGDLISIQRHPRMIEMLHPSDHNFYQTCRTKLGWGTRLDNVDYRP